MPLTAIHAEIEHQYASLKETKLKLKDFSFPMLDGQPINLRTATHNKRLVLVHYFAAWCHNSNYDVVTINKLYRQYKDQGFEVIGVCEYSSAQELREFIAEHKPAYPICIEGDDKTARTASTHYDYRRKAKDERKYGTPFNILIRAANIEAKGDTFAKLVYTAAGELIEEEAEKFIKQELQADTNLKQ
ncbi:MAG TPA: TlpA disulfide reductase family protein [Blastocatellia bacterium]|nr:TlpA disulfide reductase family protein [Blastocatellia bacterium]